MREMKVHTLSYGHDYEHDTIFGVYSSRYHANKAKKSLIEITDDKYDCYIVRTFILNEKIVR